VEHLPCSQLLSVTQRNSVTCLTRVVLRAPSAACRHRLGLAPLAPCLHQSSLEPRDTVNPRQRARPCMKPMSQHSSSMWAGLQPFPVVFRESPQRLEPCGRHPMGCQSPPTAILRRAQPGACLHPPIIAPHTYTGTRS
jgi:hypothetical protein